MSLANPEAAIAAVPSLLGFTPHHSVVVLWMRDGELALTQRIDLPVDARPPAAWLDACVNHVGAAAAHEAIIVVFASRGNDRELPFARAVDHLEARLAEHRVELIDALLADDERWFSYRCDGPCCPIQGRCIDPDVRMRVGAAFALEGVAPFPDRDAVVGSLGRDPQAHQDVRRRLPRRPRTWTERSRDAVLRGPMRRLLAGSPLDVSDSARVIAGLVDIRVRDTVLWRLSRVHDGRVVLPGFIGALRAAPDGYVAPIATVTAIAAWLTGDGARASIAVERARAEDPDYGLALLVETALRAGLPPKVWRSAMVDLDERSCRYGE